MGLTKRVPIQVTPVQAGCSLRFGSGWVWARFRPGLVFVSTQQQNLRSGADCQIFAQCEVSATPGETKKLPFLSVEMEGNDFSKVKTVCCLSNKFLPTPVFVRGNFLPSAISPFGSWNPSARVCFLFAPPLFVLLFACPNESIPTINRHIPCIACFATRI